MDRTLILVKPDAFARGLTGEIIARFERKGLRIVALKHMQMDRDLATQHYAEHEGKPFFGELVEFITSGPLVAMVLEGHEAVAAARQVIGATNPLEARTRLDPRRLRARGRPEHGPRLGLERVRRARGEALLPRTLSAVSCSSSLRARRSGERSSSSSGSSSGSSRPTSRSSPRATRARSSSRTRCARRARSRATSCWAPTPRSSSTAGSSASRPTEEEARAIPPRARRAARTRCGAGSRCVEAGERADAARRDPGDLSRR